MILTTSAFAALALFVSETDEFLAACGAEADAEGAPHSICQCIADEAERAGVVAEILASMEETDMDARLDSLSDEAMAAVAACVPQPE